MFRSLKRWNFYSRFRGASDMIMLSTMGFIVDKELVMNEKYWGLVALAVICCKSRRALNEGMEKV